MKNLEHEIANEEEYYSLVRKVFHVLAPFYDTVTAFDSALRDKVVDVTDAANGSRILDVATGTGKQALAFARKGYDVTGIDLSEDMLKVAGKKNMYANLRFQVGDATNLPFEDDSFDVSSVAFALHDMPPTIRERALKEMARVTKAKGTVVIVDYALPRNKISRFLVYHLVKLWEKYYPQFIKSDLHASLRESGIEVRDSVPALFGTAGILKGTRIDNDAHYVMGSGTSLLGPERILTASRNR